MSVAEDPGRLQAQAEALLDMGRPEAALDVLGRAAALDPSAMRPHALRASSLIALRRYDEAQVAAGEAIARAPEVSYAHRLLAIAQLKNGGEKAARRSALRALELDPEQALNYVVLAEALQATRDEAGAIAAVRHAVELDPESWIPHDVHGRLLLDHEQPAAAEACFRRALALDPENEAVLNNLALALAIQGRRHEAVAGMEAATRIDPADARVRRNTLLMARRHMAWVRGTGIAVVLVAVVLAVLVTAGGELSVESVAVCALLALAGIGLYELGIRGAARRASGPTGQLLLAEHRAKRLKPWRWDWSWIMRLRPWWWLALQRIPPPYALALNVLAGLLVPLLLLGVPFSAWRAWRWYRRTNPGRGSWRPPR